VRPPTRYTYFRKEGNSTNLAYSGRDSGVGKIIYEEALPEDSKRARREAKYHVRMRWVDGLVVEQRRTFRGRGFTTREAKGELQNTEAEGGGGGKWPEGNAISLFGY